LDREQVQGKPPRDHRVDPVVADQERSYPREVNEKGRGTMNIRHRHRRRAALVAAACLALFLAAGAAQAATPPAKLLRTYEPVTQFDSHESFLPTSVQSFIADSDLEQLVAGNWVLVNPDPEPGELPQPGTGIWRLNQDSCTPAAPIGGLACYAPAWDQGSGGPGVYGRVVKVGDGIVLQYWYFYYDDVYSYLYPPSDVIWQAHEGDWEVVNVVLSEQEEPLSVGYSQHCLGERRSWEDTPRLDEGTHPIVYVAIGSHANYFGAGLHPLNLACIPPPVQQFFLDHHLPFPVDYAFGGGPVTGPPESAGMVMPIHKISDDGPAWVSFDGFWGELQYFHAPGLTAPLGTSPRGPAYHSVWTDPLGTLDTWPSS
jgi:hypothetical protein